MMSDANKDSSVEHERERPAFSDKTWRSVLTLLDWEDFMIPVDQTILWRRHVAWSKLSGKELRESTVQRFSSTMVFMSLIVVTEIGTLLNSANLTTAMRSALTNVHYQDPKFYMGLILIVASFISVIGLFATFTAWGIVSSIDDNNAHALLRSSMGMYVTLLPSRFVVAALYLFLLILVFLVFEILGSALLKFAVLALVSVIFFHTVISLSSFGRLIVHTGAMGHRNVLDPEYERLLLPSGLHAALVIAATERRRRRTTVHAQYTAQNRRKRVQSIHSSTTSAPDLRSSKQSLLDDHEAEPATIGGGVRESGALPSDVSAATPPSLTQHISVDELFHQINFPPPALLNRTSTRRIGDLVRSTLTPQQRRAPMAASIPQSLDYQVSLCDLMQQMNQPPATLSRTSVQDLVGVVQPTQTLPTAETTPDSESPEKRDSLLDSIRPTDEEATFIEQMREIYVRNSMMVNTKASGITRRALRRNAINEWETEEDVRQLYQMGAPPPLMVEEADEDVAEQDDEENRAGEPVGASTWTSPAQQKSKRPQSGTEEERLLPKYVASQGGQKPVGFGTLAGGSE